MDGQDEGRQEQTTTFPDILHYTYFDFSKTVLKTSIQKNVEHSLQKTGCAIQTVGITSLHASPLRQYFAT